MKYFFEEVSPEYYKCELNKLSNRYFRMCSMYDEAKGTIEKMKEKLRDYEKTINNLKEKLKDYEKQS